MSVSLVEETTQRDEVVLMNVWDPSKTFNYVPCSPNGPGRYIQSSGSETEHNAQGHEVNTSISSIQPTGP